MNYKIYSPLAAVALLWGCAENKNADIGVSVPDAEIAVFTSTDKTLQKSYEWAREMALSCAGDISDPVGLWYAAAFPKREAFCMRNVSHQAVGAQILGLREHNKNMFSHFVENISENKDWCSYWEINRYNNPAPADYRNDKEFWYNLNANFDVMQACWKMYGWTGDDDYVSSEPFSYFFARSANDFVERWNLDPDKIMTRSPYMNRHEKFDKDNKFHTCRGLPSYVETIPGISAGVDLIAALYGGFDAYARISAINSGAAAADWAQRMASAYRHIIESEWWDEGDGCYNATLLEDGKFTRGEGVPYILWFGATENPERICKTLSDISSQEWNVENLSHFPMLFYRYGYNDEGYDYLVNLPTMTRADYPEVSFGFIEGCVCGAMGFQPSFADKCVATVSRLTSPDIDSEIRNIAVFDGYMSLHHVGNTFTEISNNTSIDLKWDVSFIGDYQLVEVEGKIYPAEKSSDIKGNIISTAHVDLAPKTTLTARAFASNSGIASAKK